MKQVDERAVELNVRLSPELAREAEEADPEVISQILAHGLTCRAIFEHLRDEANESPGDPLREPVRQVGD